MGLDMYLTAEVYIGGNYHLIKQDRLDVSMEYKSHLDGREDDFSRVKTYPTEDISSIHYSVGYWRKANQIHKWFVDNVQDGVDDCEMHIVSDGKVENLLNLCKELLAKRDKKEALELLPPCDGCFFGLTNTNDNVFWEYYWADLTITIPMLEKALKFADDYCADIYYQSSW